MREIKNRIPAIKRNIATLQGIDDSTPVPAPVTTPPQPAPSNSWLPQLSEKRSNFAFARLWSSTDEKKDKKPKP